MKAPSTAAHLPLSGLFCLSSGILLLLVSGILSRPWSPFASVPPELDGLLPPRVALPVVGEVPGVAELAAGSPVTAPRPLAPDCSKAAPETRTIPATSSGFDIFLTSIHSLLHLSVKPSFRDWFHRNDRLRQRHCNNFFRSARNLMELTALISLPQFERVPCPWSVRFVLELEAAGVSMAAAPRCRFW